MYSGGQASGESPLRSPIDIGVELESVRRSTVPDHVPADLRRGFSSWHRLLAHTVRSDSLPVSVADRGVTPYPLPPIERARSAFKFRFEHLTDPARRAERSEWRPPMFDDPAPLAKLFGLANAAVRPLLQSPLHRILSGRLMLLSYTGGKTGRQYLFAIGYFHWDAGDVLAFSSGNWPKALGGARDVRVLIKGTWFGARPSVISDDSDKADLLPRIRATQRSACRQGVDAGLTRRSPARPGEARRGIGQDDGRALCSSRIELTNTPGPNWQPSASPQTSLEATVSEGPHSRSPAYT